MKFTIQTSKIFASGVLIGSGVIATVAILAPKAHGVPATACLGTPATYSWNDPCRAFYPPWNSSNWRPVNGIEGTWGPDGYTPCTTQRGCS